MPNRDFSIELDAEFQNTINDLNRELKIYKEISRQDAVTIAILNKRVIDLEGRLVNFEKLLAQSRKKIDVSTDKFSLKEWVDNAD